MSEKDDKGISIEERALKKATDKADFLSHLLVYLTVNFFLLLLNLATSSDHLWVQYVILAWGIGIALHFVSVFIIDGMLDGFKDKMFESELKKLKQKEQKS